MNEEITFVRKFQATCYETCCRESFSPTVNSECLKKEESEIKLNKTKSWQKIILGLKRNKASSSCQLVL